MKWFFNLFNKNTSQELIMKKYLIVGLGNIGVEYANTRHNIGFKLVDFIANEENLSFEQLRYGAIAKLKIKGNLVFFLKPNTFMNLSGKAVVYWLNKENISVENLLVITDDLNLPFGSIRIKPKGSDGGHNGLKSIQTEINTTNYPRFRFGISDDFKKGQQIKHVLGEWTDTEKENLKERLKLSKEIVLSFILSGIAETMNSFNGK